VTTIGWTDKTWNPTRGCSRVSAGCESCYAERMAHRNMGGHYDGLTRMTSRGPTWTGEIRLVPEMLDKPLRWRKPQRVFVDSMSDLFHEGVPDEYIDSVFQTMAMARRHTFQILTKRPERMRAYLESADERHILAIYGALQEHGGVARKLVFSNLDRLRGESVSTWPLPNVHLGVSVENQETADERIPLLLQAHAAVRFLSVEPLLGQVDLSQYIKGPEVGSCARKWSAETREAVAELAKAAWKVWGVQWVIVGSESGPRRRPMRIEWARSIVEQCAEAGVACFVKQISNAADPKGEDPTHWPPGHWPRDFPR